MGIKYTLFCSLLILLAAAQAGGQVKSGMDDIQTVDSTFLNDRRHHIIKGNREVDIIDAYHSFRAGHAVRRVDTGVNIERPHFSAMPAAGYTLQTGFAALAVANGTFYTVKNGPENISTIQLSLTYSQRSQIILPLEATIWTRDNKYCIVTDWRYLKYPSYTYGLGGYSSFDNQYTIDYDNIHFHQAILRKVAKDLYAGLGYSYDYFWDIQELDPPKPTDFEKYGLSATEEASGITVNFIYDNRKNPLNPLRGGFANIIYRPNLTFFGNATSWRSLALDFRKYIAFPKGTDNVLALWNYDWLTVSGNPPYLMLPNTGGDPYSNTGRGYIQGRFRSKNMVYVEGEYRFTISPGGLLGGVIFANAQSFTEQTTSRFEVVSPGYGAGIRLKLNKFSRTNIALDYGFGTNGSGGFFVNLGEVF